MRAECRRTAVGGLPVNAYGGGDLDGGRPRPHGLLDCIQKQMHVIDETQRHHRIRRRLWC